MTRFSKTHVLLKIHENLRILNKSEKKKKLKEQRNDVITTLTPVRRFCFAKCFVTGSGP